MKAKKIKILGVKGCQKLKENKNVRKKSEEKLKTKN